MLDKNPKMKLEPESISLQDQVHIKKTAIFTKWEKKNVNLTPNRFIILSSSGKNREYELKDYEVKK